MITATLLDTAIDTLTASIDATGGGSYWFGESPLRGYSVGNNEYAIQTDRDGLKAAIARMWERSQSLGCNGVGVWLDAETGTIYVDPITHLIPLEDALALAAKNWELAIWDIGNAQCIDTRLHMAS